MHSGKSQTADAISETDAAFSNRNVRMSNARQAFGM